MDPEHLNDTQLNHHIADLRAQRRILQTRLDDALTEWTDRHGTEPGTCISTAGVTIRLTPHRRWDPDLARTYLTQHPELADQITTTAPDRERAKELLDEDAYARCQRTLPKPKITVELD